MENDKKLFTKGGPGGPGRPRGAKAKIPYISVEELLTGHQEKLGKPFTDALFELLVIEKLKNDSSEPNNYSKLMQWMADKVTMDLPKTTVNVEEPMNKSDIDEELSKYGIHTEQPKE